jgi:hypothetical protein
MASVTALRMPVAVLRVLSEKKKKTFEREDLYAHFDCSSAKPW